jgi:hypothetical protein
MEPSTAIGKATRKLFLAQARLREAEAAEYCCDASKNQAVGKARKQVKRWSNWLADNAVLTDDGGRTEE